MRDVLTAQKEHPRVQVSPMIMIVAVAVPSPSECSECSGSLESPPQHSPMLGHLASSQTVARPRLRTVDRSFWYFSEVAGGARSQDGFGRILAGLGAAFLRTGVVVLEVTLEEWGVSV